MYRFCDISENLVGEKKEEKRGKQITTASAVRPFVGVSGPIETVELWPAVVADCGNPIDGARWTTHPSIEPQHPPPPPGGSRGRTGKQEQENKRLSKPRPHQTTFYYGDTYEGHRLELVEVE